MIASRSHPLHLCDPFSRLLGDLRGDATSRVRILEMPLEDVPLSGPKTVEAGDIRVCGVD
jgi:hypothetical protein